VISIFTADRAAVVSVKERELLSAPLAGRGSFRYVSGSHIELRKIYTPEGSKVITMKDKKILITGAGGFIGGALVADLRADGYTDIRAVDVKPLEYWYQRFDDVENLVLDLNLRDACFRAVEGVHRVYNLAANMGGMGFIETNKALCMLSVLINTHLLEAAKHYNLPDKFFYASSACVYNGTKQTNADVTALKEEDAYPALAEDGYGWEKLFSERMCRHFREDFGIQSRVARFHNVYGPHGTYDGGREKAPAAMCRKVINAKMAGESSIEIWGDGHQTRSFMYITDCIYGIKAITDSDIVEPINLGSSELVSINQLADIVEDIAGVKLHRSYNLGAPKGVRGRNSDNTLIKQNLKWEPNVHLRDGMAKTYSWIEAEMNKGKASVVNLT
jgi:GDP-D-mannose 3', 5'-epimerase